MLGEFERINLRRFNIFINYKKKLVTFVMFISNKQIFNKSYETSSGGRAV